MAEKIRPFFAPTQELRSSPAAAAAWETAARRIGPAYADIARNETAQGKIAADLFKQELWPVNIAKLYEQRDRDATAAASSDAKKAASQNISFRVRGPINSFGGPTTSWSSDPTKDFADPGTEGTPDTAKGHAQVSRGAGALGRALSGGGYALGDQHLGGDYPGQQTIDPNTGLPFHPRDYTAFNKAQDAVRAYNKGNVLEPAQTDYERKIEANSLTGPNIEGPSSTAFGGNNYLPENSDRFQDSSGGFFSGLRNFISNLSSPSASFDGSSTESVGTGGS